jgi:hypothetical protein
MDTPDERRKQLDVDTTTSSTGPNTTYLIYYWRGTHDFLWFRLDNGRVTVAEWQYSYE